MLSDTPIPPGETVEEEIEYIGMSKKQLADETGISLQAIDEIFRGEMPITYDIADVFEQTLGISASLLVSLEARYQRTLSQKLESENTTAVR